MTTNFRIRRQRPSIFGTHHSIPKTQTGEELGGLKIAQFVERTLKIRTVLNPR
jgi:hypothetical protein